MGERGPLPLPYARRRNKRRTSGKAVTVARPALPKVLTGEARAEWQRVVPELEEAGVLAKIDRAVLVRYCVAWADWCELESMLGKSGKLIRGQKGNLVRNPLWLMKRDAEQTVTELSRQLGLTPIARLRSGIAHERPADPEDEERGIRVMERYRKMVEG